MLCTKTDITRAVIATILLLLYGCASTYPKDPGEQLALHVKYLNQYIQEGDARRVSYHLTESINKEPGNKTIIGLIKSNDKIRQYTTEYFCGMAKTTADKSDLQLMISNLHILNSSTLPLDLRHCESVINDQAISGRYKWSLFDDTGKFASLQNQDIQASIFHNTLQLISADRSMDPHHSKITAFLDRTKHDKALNTSVASVISTSRIPVSLLKIIRPYYPELVDDKIAISLINVHLSVINDRLLEEDIKAILGQTGDIVFSKDGAAKLDISIEKLRHDEKTLPTQSQTISYAKHEVNIVSAVLLMPRAATYVYDISTGGTELEYGYAITIKSNAKIVSDEIVRGLLEAKFTACSNKRIVNVFGGTSVADFVANSDMENRCSRQGTQRDTRQLRQDLTKLLADNINSKLTRLTEQKHGS